MDGYTYVEVAIVFWMHPMIHQSQKNVYKLLLLLDAPRGGGEVGIPALKAWNLASRPMPTTSYFPTPVVKPNTAAAGNRTHSGLPVFGLEVRQLRGPRQDSNWVCPRGGLGPHRPPTSILV